MYFLQDKKHAGNLNVSLWYYREAGLFNCGFLKYKNEIHKAAWFRKMNSFISAIMFIFIVSSVQQSLLKEG